MTSASASSAAPVAIATWPFGLTAVEAAAAVLRTGGAALDAAVAGAQAVEDDPAVTSVGFGGLPNSLGVVQLDACVMDGRTLDCGAVAGLENIRHAAAVARRVMETTPHVLLVGEGARRFAIRQGFAEENLLTEASLSEWAGRQARKSASDPRSLREGGAAAHAVLGGAAVAAPDTKTHDTVTVLCRDATGRLGGCCTTSGLSGKLPGRVGDSPIIGAGLYVDDSAGAAGCTGVGEEAIRIAAAALMVEAMRAGRSAQQAADLAAARHNTVAARRGRSPAAIAFIALTPDGETGAACTAGTGFAYAVFRDGRCQRLTAVEIG